MPLNEGVVKVGIVTEEEKSEAQYLFERILGLQELLPVAESRSMPQDEKELYYNKIVQDLGSTKRKLEEWWSAKSKKYNWMHTPGGSWQIDFNTNTILLKNQCA